MTAPQKFTSEIYLTLKEVLAIVPMGRSTWLTNVDKKICPQPMRISPRRVAWLESEIESYLQTQASKRPEWRA
jgi:predicted DNA-binding transcriptional regulator AlpA